MQRWWNFCDSPALWTVWGYQEEKLVPIKDATLGELIAKALKITAVVVGNREDAIG
jgi:hypothetical protein